MKEQPSNPTQEEEDLWWLQALQNGDEAGFNYVYERYRRQIYSRVYQVLKNHEDAEEASQNTFMRIWQRSHLWDPRIGKFSSWISKIATNAALDILRKNTKLRSRERLAYGDEDGEEMLHRYPDERPLPDELLEAEERMNLIVESLEMVQKENHREAVKLRHLKEMSIAEIAEAMGQKENTVKVWIHRGLAEWQKILRRRGLSPNDI
ncbi:MAG: RNA polymerase sigma factor [Candidatus Poribacteria bacterium]|nr:RNA polymerase sigma factor [Candidatus Poribacteria bacterium]